MQTIDHAIRALQDKKRRLSTLVVHGLGAVHRANNGGVGEEDVCDIMGLLDFHSQARDESKTKARHQKRKRD